MVDLAILNFFPLVWRMLSFFCPCAHDSVAEVPGVPLELQRNRSTRCVRGAEDVPVLNPTRLLADRKRREW